MMRNIFWWGTTPDENPWSNIGLLILRVFTGLSMALAHGWGKLMNPGGITEGVTNMGFPMPGVFAWAAIISEFFGGILIAMGLLTRPASLFLTITMVVAAFIRHADDPFSRKEKALLYAAICLFLVMKGAGTYSLDQAISRRMDGGADQ
ncbi:MAG: DoxX family protein [Bacteroidota bacterium]